MRKIIGILVCLLIIGKVWSVEYQPYSFNSTSAYIHPQKTESARTNAMRPQTYGSMSTISSANFMALNSEGGACYSPEEDTPRMKRGVARPDSGSGGIGVSDYHSPIGATPWIMMVLLAGAYVLKIHRRVVRFSCPGSPA